jgi:hypothetical protein
LILPGLSPLCARGITRNADKLARIDQMQLSEFALADEDEMPPVRETEVRAVVARIALHFLKSKYLLKFSTSGSSGMCFAHLCEGAWGPEIQRRQVEIVLSPKAARPWPLASESANPPPELIP